MERLVQGLIIGGIVLLIGGTLAWEQWLHPRYRRWRARRRHRHAVELLRAYRNLRGQARARQLVRAMEVIREIVGEDVPVLVGPGGRVTILAGRAVLPPSHLN